MHPLAFFNRANGEYIDELYEKYLKDPMSVEEPWRSFFMGFDAAQKPETQRPFRRKGATAPAPATAASTAAMGPTGLVHAYRELGHWLADIDPLGVPRAPQPLLDLSEFGFSEADLGKTIGDAGFLGTTDGTLGGLITALKREYCGTFAAEFMHIADKTQRRWLQERIEPTDNDLSKEDAQRTFRFLQAADGFEQFLHTRFLGQKRFSCEGGESLLASLGALIDTGAATGATEMIFGMAHRGRLNVLAHILGKPYEAIFAEFLGAPMVEVPPSEGDVKYHQGYRTTYRTPDGREVALSLCPNPSHLELVDPVVEGMVFARQELRQRDGGAPQDGRSVERGVVPVLIHGEAAFTGQGIVFETLSLAHLERYGVGGTVHIIVNNQVGFTATPAQTRSSPYPTEAAKLVHAPVFHVNGNDPEAVVRASRLAMEFRQEFGRDVFIDMWCYRRFGHNEGDDPTFTQPLMYKRIDAMKPVAAAYADRLIATGRIDEATVEKMREERHGKLEEAYSVARKYATESTKKLESRTEKPAKLKAKANRGETGVARAVLVDIAKRPLAPPAGFQVHPKLQKLMAQRLEMTEGKKALDWGTAEMLALGSLLAEGVPVRLTGQDSERGTFSHRHAVLHDIESGAVFTPLASLSPKPDTFTVINTMLSELAVLGFEYGYSIASPETLVLWEAQFGDFVNGAQPIIDQFIAPGEAKWQLPSGLVLLLPHGYEGQGPEHSSARLERFLQLYAEDNLQVCQPSTPASFFHMVRRQARLEPKKPLIVMTPKSLLRNPLAVSPIEELEKGSFSPVIDDIVTPKAARRVAFCSGKVFFTLAAAREKAKADDVVIYRLEQLAPFPGAEISEKLALHPQAEVIWVQDEPRNMGAWPFLAPRLQEVAGTRPIGYVGRPEAASPATGNAKQHERQEAAIVEQALGKRS